MFRACRNYCFIQNGDWNPDHRGGVGIRCNRGMCDRRRQLECSVLKTVVGVFVLAFISNIMNLLAVPAYPQDIIKGVIIVLSVLLQEFTTRKSETI